jgi:hypothetical protein
LQNLFDSGGVGYVGKRRCDLSTNWQIERHSLCRGPQVHRAAFALPRFIADIVGS